VLVEILTLHVITNVIYRKNHYKIKFPLKSNRNFLVVITILTVS